MEEGLAGVVSQLVIGWAVTTTPTALSRRWRTWRLTLMWRRRRKVPGSCCCGGQLPRQALTGRRHLLLLWQGVVVVLLRQMGMVQAVATMAMERCHR